MGEGGQENEQRQAATPLANTSTTSQKVTSRALTTPRTRPAVSASNIRNLSSTKNTLLQQTDEQQQQDGKEMVNSRNMGDDGEEKEQQQQDGRPSMGEDDEEKEQQQQEEDGCPDMDEDNGVKVQQQQQYGEQIIDSRNMGEDDEEKSQQQRQDGRPSMGEDNEEKEQHQHQQGGKPRRWLKDRCDGVSKIDPDNRPPIRICWPPPPIKYLPDFFEQNSCCQAIGSVGCFDPNDDQKYRSRLMRLCIFIHTIGIVLSILACLAISNDKNLLKAFPFSSGIATGTVDIEGLPPRVFTFKTGLRKVYLKDDMNVETTFGWDEACKQTNTSEAIPFTEVAKCRECKDASSGLVLTVILAVVTYIPTVATNFTRMYHNYDVNCQKFFGTLVGFISGLLSLYTWQGYSESCFESFLDGEVELTVVVKDLGMQVARVDFDWKPGLGLLFVIAATFMKIVDIICHLMIRTPTITRDRKEQLDYEAKYYGDDTNVEAPAGDEE